MAICWLKALTVTSDGNLGNDAAAVPARVRKQSGIQESTVFSRAFRPVWNRAGDTRLSRWKLRASHDFGADGRGRGHSAGWSHFVNWLEPGRLPGGAVRSTPSASRKVGNNGTSILFRPKLRRFNRPRSPGGMEAHG